MKKTLKYSFVFIFLLLGSCNYMVNKASDSNAKSGTGGVEVPAGTIPGFDIILQNVLGPRCLECHSNAGGNKGGINLETYEATYPKLSDIRNDVATSRMPLSRPPLTAREKEILFQWIDAGAPKAPQATAQNPAPPPPQTTPDPLPSLPPIPVPPSEEINYQTVRDQVLQPSCVGCHSAAGGNRGGLNFEDYEKVRLEMRAIESEVRAGTMPPRRPLTEAQKNILLAWIQNGAPK